MFNIEFPRILILGIGYSLLDILSFGVTSLDFIQIGNLLNLNLYIALLFFQEGRGFC